MLNSVIIAKNTAKSVYNGILISKAKNVCQDMAFVYPSIQRVVLVLVYIYMWISSFSELKIVDFKWNVNRFSFTTCFKIEKSLSNNQKLCKSACACSHERNDIFSSLWAKPFYYLNCCTC